MSVKFFFQLAAIILIGIASATAFVKRNHVAGWFCAGVVCLVVADDVPFTD